MVTGASEPEGATSFRFYHRDAFICPEFFMSPSSKMPLLVTQEAALSATGFLLVGTFAIFLGYFVHQLTTVTTFQTSSVVSEPVSGASCSGLKINTYLWPEVYFYNGKVSGAIYQSQHHSTTTEIYMTTATNACETYASCLQQLLPDTPEFCLSNWAASSSEEADELLAGGASCPALVLNFDAQSTECGFYPMSYDSNDQELYSVYPAKTGDGNYVTLSAVQSHPLGSEESLYPLSYFIYNDVSYDQSTLYNLCLESVELAGSEATIESQPFICTEDTIQRQTFFQALGVAYANSRFFFVAVAFASTYMLRRFYPAPASSKSQLGEGDV